MGNGYGKIVNTKSPSLNKCSDGVWVRDQVHTLDKTMKFGNRDDGTKNDLISKKAYIDPVTLNFCSLSSRGDFGVNDKDVSDLYDLNRENASSKIPVTGKNRWWDLANPFNLFPREFDDNLDGAITREEQLCTSIGDPGEWVPFREEDKCHYNDADKGYAVNNWEGNIVGAMQSCARANFTADPVVCCFNDYDCNRDDDKCFQTPARQATCHPDHRNLNSSFCRTAIEKYCTGEETFPTQSNWLEMWLDDAEVEINSKMATSNKRYRSTFYSKQIDVSERGKRYPSAEKQPCLRAIARNITNQSICTWDDLQAGSVITGVYDPDGLEWSRNIINKVLEKFSEENEEGLLGGINRPGGSGNQNSFYNTLWTICNKIPLLCTNGSKEYPEGILHKLCEGVTAENLSENPNLIRWCACYMDEDQYIPSQDKYNISKECTPMCNREGVIPSVNADGERRVCLQNLCVLDDININISASQFSDDSSINFTQICPSCGKSSIQRSYDLKTYRKYSSSKSYMLNNIPELESSQDSYEAAGLVYDGGYGVGYSTNNFPQFNIDPNDIKTWVIKCVYLLEKDTQGFPDTLSAEDYKESIDVLFGYREEPNIEGFVLGVVNAYTIKDVEATLDQPFVVAYKFNEEGGDHQKLTLDSSSGQSYYAGTNNETMTLVTTKESIGEVSYEKITDFLWTGAESLVTANTCHCYMNTDLTILNSKFSGDINFTQECGRSSCFDDDGNPISCASTSDEPISHQSFEFIERATAEEEAKEKYSLVFNILLAVSVFLLLVYYIYILINR